MIGGLKSKHVAILSIERAFIRTENICCHEAWGKLQKRRLSAPAKTIQIQTSMMQPFHKPETTDEHIQKHNYKIHK